MMFHSIRWRWQSWLAFLLISVLSGFGVTVYQLQRIKQSNQIDEELRIRVAALGEAVRGGPPPAFGPGRPALEPMPPRPGSIEQPRRPFPPPERRDPSFPGPPGERPMGLRELGPREFRPSAEVLRLFDESQTNGFYYTIWSRDGLLLKRSTNAPAVSLPENPKNTLTHGRTREGFRESFQFTERNDCVLAGRDIGGALNELRAYAWWLLAAGGMVLAFGLGGGWWLTARAIRPLEQINATARRISQDNLSERIKASDVRDEFGKLVGVLNATFARLEAAFAQQQQFTADAAHELRTPLAVLISEAQTALSRERNQTEYRETIKNCLETAQQMRRLTESLLELARLDAGPGPSQGTELNLSEIARRAVERMGSLAQERGIQIHCELNSVDVVSHPDRLEHVIANLLANAIYYNQPNGEVRLSTRQENGKALLRVSDTGIGIAAEDLPHVFERFYRADKSRSRGEGHCGLGLAICQAIIAAEGGSIEVASQLGVGSTFTIALPNRAPGEQTAPPATSAKTRSRSLGLLLLGIGWTLSARGALAPGPVATASSTATATAPAGALDGDRFSVAPGTLWQGASGRTSWWWQVQFPAPRQVGAILQIVGDHDFVLRNAPRRYRWQGSIDGITWQVWQETTVESEARLFRVHRLRRARSARFVRLEIDSATAEAPALREVEFYARPDSAVPFPEWVLAVNTTHENKLPGQGQEFIPLARSCSGQLQGQQVWLDQFDPAFVAAEPKPLAAFLSGNFKDWCEVDRRLWRGTEEVLRQRRLPLWASCGGAQGLALLWEYGAARPWDCPHCRDPRRPRTPLYTHIGHTAARPCGDYSGCVFERGPHWVRKVGADPAFAGLERDFQVMESHCGQIESPPRGWIQVATAGEGTLTRMQCLRLRGHCVYAAQFHIEMAGTPATSRRIMENFLQLAREWNARK